MPQVIHQLTVLLILLLLALGGGLSIARDLSEERDPMSNAVAMIVLIVFAVLLTVAGTFDRLPDLFTALRALQ